MGSPPSDPDAGSGFSDNHKELRLPGAIPARPPGGSDASSGSLLTAKSIAKDKPVKVSIRRTVGAAESDGQWRRRATRVARRTAYVGAFTLVVAGLLTLWQVLFAAGAGGEVWLGRPWEPPIAAAGATSKSDEDCSSTPEATPESSDDNGGADDSSGSDDSSGRDDCSDSDSDDDNSGPGGGSDDSETEDPSEDNSGSGSGSGSPAPTSDEDSDDDSGDDSDNSGPGSGSGRSDDSGPGDNSGPGSGSDDSPDDD